MAVTGQKTGFRAEVIAFPGGLLGWGENSAGQLALGDSNNGKAFPQRSGDYSIYKQISCGYAHSLAVKTDGTLWTWGRNDYGTLGNGTTINYSSPIQIGFLNTWSQVSGGTFGISAAIKTDGTLWMWGFNQFGSLGNGTVTSYSSPIQIGALTNWNKISCGYLTAAIKTDGTLWTWGRNNNGQLGNGTTTNYSSPIQIGSLTNWSQVATQEKFFISIKTDGTLWSCGYNNYGQLGNGTTVNYSSPIQVGSSSNWSKVACGYGSVSAIKTDGTLWGWGASFAGSLGDGTTDAKSTPVQIGSLTTWSQVAKTRAYSSYFIKTDGTLWSCGYNNYGQLGNGTININYSSPIQVGSLTTWKYIAGGMARAIIGLADPYKTNLYGGTWGEGYNGQGQLGTNIRGNYYTGIQRLLPDVNYKSLSSSYHTLAVKTDGTLWACGYNVHGNLGNETTIRYSSPIQIGSLTNWKQVTAGASISASYAIKTDGTLWTWGDNTYGQLGNGTNTNKYSSPIQIGSLTNWNILSKGAAPNVVSIKTDGTLWTWGRNDYGQLGNGTIVYYSSPIQVGSLTNWSQVSCGGGGAQFVLSIKTDGTLWGWGWNDYGQLGNGTTIKYSSPIQVGSLTNWSQVTCGQDHVVALKTDGTLWTWGSGGNYALGNNSTTSRSSPIQIGSLTNWNNIGTAISTGFAVRSDGTLWGWGYHAGGDNQTFSVPTLLSDSNWINSIISGNMNSSSVVIYRDNSGQDLGERYVSKDYLLDVYPTIASVTGARTAPGLWMWGYNTYGQTGQQTTISYSSPVQVGALTTWKQAACGNYNSAAIKTDGTLWTFGQNQKGEVGNGTSDRYSSPIQIGSLTNWKQVSCGYNTAAIKTDGTLWTWGYNSKGQLGNSTTTHYSSPIQIGSLTNWKQVACGYHTLAIKTDGSLWAWGVGSAGPLGNGTTTNYSSPIQIGSLTNWKQVDVSVVGSYSAAIKTDGTLWTWGLGNDGRLGLGVVDWYSSPVQVGSLTNWKQVACGKDFLMAIKTDGSLWTCGYNGSGSLGLNNRISYSSPVQVGFLTNWKFVDCGGGPGTSGHTLAIKTDGTMWSWGRNDYGQTGLGVVDTITYSSPVQVGSLTNWKQVACGYKHSASIGDGYY